MSMLNHTEIVENAELCTALCIDLAHLLHEIITGRPITEPEKRDLNKRVKPYQTKKTE